MSFDKFRAYSFSGFALCSVFFTTLINAAPSHADQKVSFYKKLTFRKINSEILLKLSVITRTIMLHYSSDCTVI